MLRPADEPSRPRRGAMITGSGLAVVDEAERMIAEVRDDPAGRIRLAADAYAFGRGGRRYRPYRRAVVAFMRWQQGRVSSILWTTTCPAARGGAR